MLHYLPFGLLCNECSGPSRGPVPGPLPGEDGVPLGPDDEPCEPDPADVAWLDELPNPLDAAQERAEAHERWSGEQSQARNYIYKYNSIISY